MADHGISRGRSVLCSSGRECCLTAAQSAIMQHAHKLLLLYALLCLSGAVAEVEECYCGDNVAPIEYDAASGAHRTVVRCYIATLRAARTAPFAVAVPLQSVASALPPPLLSRGKLQHVHFALVLVSSLPLASALASALVIAL